ncbi:MAG: chorismate mutase [Candidatus Hydrothermarchaeota archaeon]|nr:MAG: chorismate mutase [Candidatus Hydrothermarchaeota archaeon]
MSIDKLRKQIDEIDEEILTLIAKRMQKAKKIGEIKRTKGLKIKDNEREREVIEKWKRKAKELNLSKEFVEKIVKEIIRESRDVQG